MPSKRVSGLLSVLLALGGVSVRGQVRTDGRLGARQTLTGPIITVPHTLGRTVGNNLFHSFDALSVGVNESVTFSGPGNVRNVVARVSGGQPSRIDGVLGCDVPDANLFLINPAGVVFGPAGQLNVSGSFAASTADYVKLGDGGRINAAGKDVGVLTSASPVAFGFLGRRVAKITCEKFATFEVSQGHALSLVGGEVRAEGAGIFAFGGRVNLVAARSGEVTLDAADVAAKPPKLSGAGGKVALGLNTQVETSEAEGGQIHVVAGGVSLEGGARLVSDTTGAGRGGAVRIEAADVEVRRGAFVATTATGSGTAGEVVVSADRLSLDGTGSATFTGIGKPANFLGASARPGDVSVSAGRVEVAHGAEISSTNLGDVPAGAITIEGGSMAIVDGGQVIAQAGGRGSAGAVTVNVGDVQIVGNGRTPTGILSDANPAMARADGAGGAITMTGDSLRIGNLGVVSATTFGPGAGGRVDVHMGRVTVDGSGLEGFTGIAANTQQALDGGRGGDVVVRGELLRVTNEGGVAANTFGQGAGGTVTLDVGLLDLRGNRPRSDTGVFARSFYKGRGGGAGGDVVVTADAVRVRDNAAISVKSSGRGAAGGVAVTARGGVTLEDGGTIASAAPRSRGGNLRVDAGERLEMRGGLISAGARDDGGNVALRATESIYLLDSTVSAATERGVGGNIDIDPLAVVLNNSKLAANANTGNGGNVTVRAGTFLASGDSVIDVSSQFGLQGSVNILAPDIDVAGALTPLPAGLFDSQLSLKPACGVRFSGFSTFQIVGRGSLPLVPGGFSPSLGE